MFVTDLIEWDEVVGGQVVEAAADRSEGVLLGEDLGGLFQRFVLVHGDQDRGGAAPSGDGDVLAPVGHLVIAVRAAAGNADRVCPAPRLTLDLRAKVRITVEWQADAAPASLQPMVAGSPMGLRLVLTHSGAV